MIHVDASAVPDHYSGVRTRLRGLYAAYGALEDAPAVTLVVARGSGLVDGLDLGAVQRVEVESPGGPWQRARRRRDALGLGGPIDLWHAETLPPLAPATVPCLVTLHDLRFLHSAAEVGDGAFQHLARALAYRWWVPRVLRDVRGVVTVSTATEQELVRRLGLAPDRVHVIANAVEAGGSRGDVGEPADLPSRLDGLGVRAPFFLVVGHLRRRKGLEVLPAALRECVGSAGLVFVGDGVARDELQYEVRAVGVADRVWFLGRQDDAVVAGLRRRATALLFPSRVEGYGFPVFEALIAGLPVITSPLPCLDGIEGEGLVRCRRDPVEWARAMDRVLQNQVALRESALHMGETLGEDGWRRSARGLAALYRRLTA